MSEQPEAIDDRPCDDCGSHFPEVWFAPSPLWNEVMGGPGTEYDPGGNLCLRCFIVRAESAGFRDCCWTTEAHAKSLADEAFTRDYVPARDFDALQARYDKAVTALKKIRSVYGNDRDWDKDLQAVNMAKYARDALASLGESDE